MITQEKCLYTNNLILHTPVVVTTNTSICIVSKAYQEQCDFSLYLRFSSTENDTICITKPT